VCHGPCLVSRRAAGMLSGIGLGGKEPSGSAAFVLCHCPMPGLAGEVHSSLCVVGLLGNQENNTWALTLLP
jgi:hypothetical protein